MRNNNNEDPNLPTIGRQNIAIAACFQFVSSNLLISSINQVREKAENHLSI